MARVVITGGAGFIGANLARTLAESGDDVVVLDDLSSGKRTNLQGLDVELVTGSILDEEALARVIVGGVDAVVHLAARPSVARSIENPLASHHSNATGTLNVLEACRSADVGQVLAASSSSVYGDQAAEYKSEDLAQSPRSPYAASKLATESYCLAYHRSYGMSVQPFRFFNVYGPLQAAGHAYAAVVPAFVDAALRGTPLTIHGDGFQTRDFTYVDTVCEALEFALRTSLCVDAPLNLAFGSETSINELVAIVEDAVGEPVATDYGPSRSGDVKRSRADCDRLRNAMPHISPRPLSDGVGATVEWMRGVL